MTLEATTAVNIGEEMRQSYMDYAMSVIIGRALPDVRDGLKPVQRRVLYAMLSEGLVSNRKHSKCAGVVGEVLKRFHPHGDMPVYDALVRLAQPWCLRYPLIDGQGNFGSIDGDPPAAYRYTEARLTALAEKLLEDIEKETVDFGPNFDDTTFEPLVLPSVIPNLLVNGADGIAVGMATHIPPHNLREVVSGTIAFLENPNISLEEMMKYIPGPDFPTGGTIYGRSAIISAYAEGKGIIQLRGKTAFEPTPGKKETTSIVITEIPFQVNKARLIERVAELYNNKEIDGISRVRDESDRKGMRIVIELKRDATPEVVLNQLFKLTPLQTSFGIINLAIVEGKPVVCSLIELISHFVDHRRDVVVRRTQFDLRKAQARMHLLDGFRIVLLNIDEVIALIKKAQTPAEARDGLMQKYSLSEIQAQAVLDLKLQKLTGLERLAIEQEHKELAAEIARLLAILSDSKKVDQLIGAELKQVQEQFGDARRTALSEEVEEMQAEDLIEDEEMVVTISHQGYIKRIASSAYRAQRRGGKGISATSVAHEDFAEHLFIASTLSEVLVFTSGGRLYWVKVYEIPEAGRTARGRALVNLLDLKDESEKITTVLPVRGLSDSACVLMATRQGVVKKTELGEFTRSRRSGIIACSIDEGDALIGVGITSGQDEIILATKSGMAIRFEETDVRAMGRGARGVKGITLDAGDAVVSMTVVAKDAANGNGGTLLTVCENGYGKRSLLADYRVQGRGGKGLIDIKTDERNGSVIAALSVQDAHQIMIITTGGKMVRTAVGEISTIGRNTKGVKLIGLDPGERVTAVGQLVESVDADPKGE